MFSFRIRTGAPASLPFRARSAAHTYRPPARDVLHDLTSLTASGDPVAFAALHDALFAEVLDASFRVLGDIAAAIAVARAVFVEVWHMAGTCDPDGDARAWVLDIARRRATDRAATRERHRPATVLLGIQDEFLRQELNALLTSADAAAEPPRAG
ncbi:MAG TPA: hypothetical protein VFE14_03660 [Micromonosporaceae bacterium]|jgi:DNA-directed RNA polymerase specialized sigma24 family protein|nr:hypothetical protein [Micromonosporaceae bacterium]